MKRGAERALSSRREGREAIGLEDGENDSSSVPKGRRGRRRRTPANLLFRNCLNRIDEPQAPNLKQAVIIKTPSKKLRATLEALVEATGWLPHTTRAARTGLRKRGYTVLLETQE